MTTNFVLTIGGSDPSCGAGIQGDIKTISSLGCSPLCAVTALTCQNEDEVFFVQGIGSDFLRSQLKHLLSSFKINAVKIGMLYDQEVVEVVSEVISRLPASVPVVLDPVFHASSGKGLLSDSGISAMKEKLIPLVTIITPNILEAARLSDLKIETEEEMIKSAKIISSFGVSSILIKGGHLLSAAKCRDLFYHSGEFYWLSSERILGKPLHGTGCALSSAIACELSKGSSLLEAVKSGKKYIFSAISSAFSENLKSVDHFWMTRLETSFPYRELVEATQL